jgi:hypothetical protein
MHHARGTELAFALGGLFGQDMAAKRLHTFEGTGSRASKTLGRATVGLDLGHISRSFKVAGFDTTPQAMPEAQAPPGDTASDHPVPSSVYALLIG